MPKPQKIEAVAELSKLFADSGSFFVTDYQGLNVGEITLLRKNFRENSIKYLVAKNSLLKRAAYKAGYESIDRHLIGPTAIAFAADDPIVAAKILHDSFKERELPRVKVFVVDGRFYEAEEIKRLAALPSKETLYSQLVAAVESPLSQLVGVLSGIFRELVGTLEALSERKKSEV
ncbi:MAG: 50S ribosomal protein L10 [Candidatus Zixiibacteriota bacterium]